MLVSIVIPNLNKAPFLEATLQSLFAQEYKEIELIAVDGGSTDGSREIFKRHKDKFAHYIAEPDKGQADAVNKGFALARGEIIAWLNSDDLYFPWTVRLAVERFKANPRLSLLYGDCVFIDESGNFLRYFVEVEPYNEYRLRNCSDYIMQPTTFFRKSAWEAVGGLDAGMHYAFDYDFWCKLARLKEEAGEKKEANGEEEADRKENTGGKVEYLPEPMAANREYGETKTKSGGTARMREIKEVYARHKTGWYPHGYWNFWRTELLLRRRQSQTPSARLYYQALAFGAKALGYKNCLYALRKRRTMKNTLR